MSERIQIALASDDNYFVGLLVTAVSIARHADANADLVFNVLSGRIAEEKLERLRDEIAKAHARATVRVFDVDEARFAAFPTWHGNGRMAYARLMLPDMLPDEEFVIYCDVDFLFTADIAELWGLRRVDVVVQGCLDVAAADDSRVLEGAEGKKTNLRRSPRPHISTSSPSLVRMTHANLDPLRLAYRGWKKRLVGPIERWLFSRTDRVVVTCAAEKDWCERWGLKNAFEVVDLRRLFRLKGVEKEERRGGQRKMHLLYLGRRHPLKGVRFVEQAVQEINEEVRMTNDERRKVELRIVSDHYGEELEKDWDWCDVLCLPTLSENFGLVVAEALARGKRVVTTDGAPVWDVEGEKVGGGGQWTDRLSYVRGFRDGTDGVRVKLLKEALEQLTC